MSIHEMGHTTVPRRAEKPMLPSIKIRLSCISRALNREFNCLEIFLTCLGFVLQVILAGQRKVNIHSSTGSGPHTSQQ